MRLVTNRVALFLYLPVGQRMRKTNQKIRRSRVE